MLAFKSILLVSDIVKSTHVKAVYKSVVHVEAWIASKKSVSLEAISTAKS
jgi:hypothetical protein